MNQVLLGGFMLLISSVWNQQYQRDDRNLELQDTHLIRYKAKGFTTQDIYVYGVPNTLTEPTSLLYQYTLVFIFSENADYYQIGTHPMDTLGWAERHQIVKWTTSKCLDRQSEGNFSIYENCQDRLKIGKVIKNLPLDVAHLIPIVEEKNEFGSEHCYQIGFLTQKPRTIKMEILFVIDATSSMIPYIYGLKQVIPRLMEKSRQQKTIQLKLGLYAYRDYITYQPDMGYVTKRFSDLTANLQQFLWTIESELEGTQTDSEDVAEAGFDGLYAGLAEAKWDTDRHTHKTVVFIGDASAHEEGEPKNVLNYSPQQLGRMATGKHICLTVIKIQGDLDWDNERHRQQAKTLLEHNNHLGEYIEIPNDVNAVNQYKAQLLAYFDRLMESASIDQLPVQSTSDIVLPITVMTFKQLVYSDLDHYVAKAWVDQNAINQPISVVHFLPKSEVEGLLAFLKAVWNLLDSDISTVARRNNYQIIATLLQKNLETTSLIIRDFETCFSQISELTMKDLQLKYAWNELPYLEQLERDRFKNILENKIKNLEDLFFDETQWLYTEVGGFYYTFLDTLQLP